MAAAETIEREPEIERVERWRIEELLRAGYDMTAAESLAVRHDVDLHHATDLVRSGCDPELAVKILL